MTQITPDMNILTAEVSLFESYKNPLPLRTIRMIDFLTKSNHRLSKLVYDIRNSENKDLVKSIKSMLPAITPSGIYKTRHTKELIQHSGFICLDFDDVKDMDLAWEQLQSCLYVAFLNKSVSGKGLFAIVPIKYPEQHKKHFNSLKSYMLDTYGLRIDKSCSDVSRLRGYSLPDSYYINPSATEYEYIKDDVVIPVPSFPILVRGDKDHERLHMLLDAINRSGIDITQDRDDWVKIGLALAGEYGEIGRSYFHQISRYYSKYKYNQADRQYNSFLRCGKKCSLRSIFYIAKRYGVVLN